MKKVLHRGATRGSTELGWLHSRHTFSFADYYHLERMGFGKLRVLNDDIVDPTMGFDVHHHRNMEIVSIPLSGRLRHKDSLGNEHIIAAGEVQIMSAGAGIAHSEYNDSLTEQVNFLQLWILPKQRNIPPRYDQRIIDLETGINQFHVIVSPDKDNTTAVWINQDAYCSIANLKANQTVTYQCFLEYPAVYIFLISGKLAIDDDVLQARDGLALTDLEKVEMRALQDAQILCIETTR